MQRTAHMAQRLFVPVTSWRNAARGMTPALVTRPLVESASAAYTSEAFVKSSAALGQRDAARSARRRSVSFAVGASHRSRNRSHEDIHDFQSNLARFGYWYQLRCASLGMRA